MSKFGWFLISWVIDLLHYNVREEWTVNVKNSLKKPQNLFVIFCDGVLFSTVIRYRTLCCFILCVWLCGVLRPTREYFTPLEMSPLPVKGYRSYARNSRPLRSEGSLACHAYYGTAQSFIMVISEDPWHLHLLLSVWHRSFHFLF